MIAKALFLAFNFPSILLVARAIGYEAPSYAMQDRPFVAACIRHRMLARDMTAQEVLFQPGQFSVAHLLDENPPGEDMAGLIKLALDTLMNGEPLAISHFYSPQYIEPPDWARDEWLVETVGTIHRFYLLPEWGRDGN